MRKNILDRFVDSLFGYNDYRLFIKDYFSVQKKIRASFTQRYFAAKAGFANHAFCNFVINGKRNLSENTLKKFIEALELEGDKAKYFEVLVKFNQSGSQEEKEMLYEELQKIKKGVKFKSVDTSQEFFFEQRHYSIVRELAVHSNWNGSYEKLASMVRPTITTAQAKQAIELMLENGLLTCKDGVYDYAHENVDDVSVPVFLKKKSRRQVFETAVDSFEAMSPSERYAEYTTFTADDETFNKINERFEQFRKECNELIMASEKKDKVFQLVFGNFPASYKK